jgi:hypothetical protein
MRLFVGTGAPGIIKSDCRKNATPFQMERPLNQPVRLITFLLVAACSWHSRSSHRIIVAKPSVTMVDIGV